MDSTWMDSNYLTQYVNNNQKWQTTPAQTAKLRPKKHPHSGEQQESGLNRLHHQPTLHFRLKKNHKQPLYSYLTSTPNSNSKKTKINKTTPAATHLLPNPAKPRNSPHKLAQPQQPPTSKREDKRGQESKQPRSLI